MVAKSKLKMALLHEKPVDFKKEHQKKMARKARKEKTVKLGKKVAGGDWEDVEGSEEEEDVEANGPQDDGASLGEDESEDEENPTTVRFSHLRLRLEQD